VFLACIAFTLGGVPEQVLQGRWICLQAICSYSFVERLVIKQLERWKYGGGGGGKRDRGVQIERESGDVFFLYSSFVLEGAKSRCRSVTCVSSFFFFVDHVAHTGFRLIYGTRGAFS
jgi:hypothetical protein